MSDNTTPRGSDETRGMKVARWAVWIAILAACGFFFVYAALFH